MYGLNTHHIDYTIETSNPYATTPFQVIRTIIMPRVLLLARQNKLHRGVPLVHAVTRISFVSTDSEYSFLESPTVERDVSCWNQLAGVYTNHIA